MEFQQLKYFVAVAENGSFSNAAACLNVAQPRLSRCIRALEEDLGACLFFRNGRGVVLSEAGKFLKSHCAEILETTRAIETGIQSISDNPGGTVKVGLPPSLSGLIALELIDEITRTNARVQVEIEEASVSHVLEWLYSGRVDLAILCDAPRCSTLLCQPIVEEELVLACPPTERWLTTPLVSPDMLQGKTVIIAEGSCAKLVEADFFAGVDLHRMDSVTAGLEIVRQERGFAVLPASAAAAHARSGQLAIARIPGLALSRSLSLATSTQGPLSPAVLKVSQTLAEITRRAVPKRDVDRSSVKLVA
jgi:LysR family nitrogen assimilation transcriptional regulator